MKLELKDEKGLLGTIELPLDQVRKELGLGNALEETEAQLKEKADLKDRDPLTTQVVKWVDPWVIAEMVVGFLESEGLPRTFEEAKRVWLDALEMLGGHLAELKELKGKTMDDFTAIEKATFVLAWGKGMSTEQKVKWANAVGIPVAAVAEAETKPAEAAVDEVKKEPAEVEEEPASIAGRTDKPGYKYLEHIDRSIKV